MASGSTGSRKRNTKKSNKGTGSRTSTKRVSARERELQAEEERRAREVRRDIRLLVLFAAMVFVFIADLGYGGPAGDYISAFLFGLFGTTAYILPFFIFFLVIFIISNLGKRTLPAKCIASVFLLLSAGALFELYSGALTPMSVYDATQIFRRSAAAKGGGGLLGGSIAFHLYHLFKTPGATLILVVVILICLLVITQHSVLAAIRSRRLKRIEEGRPSFWEKRRQDAAQRREESRRRREELRAQREEELLKKQREEARENRTQSGPVDLEKTAMRAGEELLDKPSYVLKSEPAFSDIPSVTREDGGRRDDVLPEENRPEGAVSMIASPEISVPEASFKEQTQVIDKGITEMTVFTAGEKEISPAGRPEFPFEKEGPLTTSERKVRTVYAPAVGMGLGMTPDDKPAVPVQDTAPETPSATAEKQRPVITEEQLRDIEVHRDRGESRAEMPRKQTRTKSRAYVYPTLDLMQKGMRDNDPDTDRILKENGFILQDTLRTFGVNVTITAISQGPSVTRYELILETGVKVSKIVSLADNIKLSLGATEVRIEAPIPGKKAIGIEVPNKKTTLVTLRDILESREFMNASSRLTFAAGKDISGKTVVADIAKMPHLLIAGATGSGKSVCINTIILSLLYKSTPDEVKMIMIDPKVVELSVYNGIPHLMIPVVTDVRKAAAALGWAAAEMDKRYRLFAQAGVRDLAGYNHAVRERIKNGEAGEETVLPRLVIIVDELADLMMIARNEVETTICRLLQLARAAGIHVIIATQRPSVDVITGLIKSNIPSRIAFAVASQVDSRTILDMAGAEKLIGKGDMLFSPQSYPKPVRLQGAFVSDEEVERIVSFIKSHNAAPSGDEEIENEISTMTVSSETGAGPGTPADERWDEHFEAAGRFIIEKDKASIGLLQRVFKIGFNRAARIMDQLCEAGVVSEESGTKARQVLMTLPEFESFLESQK